MRFFLYVGGSVVSMGALAEKKLVPPSLGLCESFWPVAISTYSLEIMVIISTATRNIQYVIKLKLATNTATYLACVFITSKYLLSLASPRPTTATMAPTRLRLVSVAADGLGRRWTKTRFEGLESHKVHLLFFGQKITPARG